MYAAQPHRHGMKKRYINDPLSTMFYDFGGQNGLPVTEFLELNPQLLNKMELSEY